MKIFDNVGKKQGLVANGGTTDDATPTISDSGATPGNRISIFDCGVELGRTDVKPDGTWVFTPSPSLCDGMHSISVVETEPSGVTSEPSAGYVFAVNTVYG